VEGHPILAATLDFAMRGVARLRPGVVGQARGRVLELGLGTGLNLPYYPKVERIDAVEPDPHMRRRAEARAEPLRLPLHVHAIGAEALPFADETFDTVLVTFVLCTVPDLPRTLLEARRVLRKDGRLLFAEHVRSREAAVARVQDLVQPLYGRISGGCQLGRDSVTAIQAAGFADVEALDRKGQWTLTPMVTGSASRGR
jgi:SAM-dependent methyltransferase